MPFELKSVTEVLLTNVNIRRELHGEENVTAIDMAMKMEGPNDLLDLLDPKLRTTLYCNRAATAGQELLPEVMAVLPNLRVPQLEQKHTYAKGDKYKGYRFVLDYGLGDERSNEDLDDCTVTGFKFETKEGGTIVLSWTVQYAGEKLDQDVRGRLTGLTQEKIHVQLIAPAVLQIVKGGKKAAPVSGGAELPEDDEDAEEEDATDNRSAGDIFAATHAVG